jgi:hypothetical protein
MVGIEPVAAAVDAGSAEAAGSAVSVTSEFNGIMPGSKQDVRTSPPEIIIRN